MLSKMVRIGLIAALLAGLFALWLKSNEWKEAAQGKAAEPERHYIENSKAVIANLDLTDLDGKSAKLPGKGRYRLINYWATWCGPCLMEMPLLDKFAQSQGANGVILIGIALDESKEVKSYLKENPLKYPQFLETPGKSDSSTQLGNKAGIIPFSVLIGPDGQLLKLKRGEFADLEELEAFVKPPKP